VAEIAQIPHPLTEEARRRAVALASQKMLLLATFVIAYLNAILRTSVDSPASLFRIILPFVTLYFVLKHLRQQLTTRLLLVLCVLLSYCLTQILLLGLSGSAGVWSYLVNLAATAIFVYFVVWYHGAFGTRSLFNHLYLWYCVLIALSVHQLITGVEYPVVPNRDDVARIFFGQENDCSLAIAAFLPMLVFRARRDPIALVLFAIGFAVTYLNGTRGVVLGIGAYPVVLAAFAVLGKFAKRARPLRPLLFAIVILFVAIPVYLFRDTHISLVGDEEGSLTTLVIDPITEAARGQMMDAEITSTNVRVTFIVIGAQHYLGTYGFGIGPGAFQELGGSIFPDLAASMHVFPLQMLAELGWMYVALMIWIIRLGVRRFGWASFMPTFIYYNLICMPITSGAITNYYFFACAAFAFLVSPAAADRLALKSEPAEIAHAAR
jgi:hypothetical protein